MKKKDSRKSFTINSKLVESILNEYKELLEKQKVSIENDRFRSKCVEELQKLNVKNFSEILEQVFIASLEKEEGKHHYFSVVISPPETQFKELLKGYTHKSNESNFRDISTFKKPIGITSLHKISPAFEFTNRKLRLWFYKGNEIKIWGFANNYFDKLCLEINTFSPGQLIIHIFSSQFTLAKYLLSFSRIERIYNNFSLNSLLFSESEIGEMSNPRSENPKKYERRGRLGNGLLTDLINKIRNHAHGGTLLIIPDENHNQILKDSIKQPIPYQTDIPYDFIKDELIAEENREIDSTDFYTYGLFDKDSDFLAQITAVDGATIITKSFELITFGAKIESKKLKGKQDILEYVWMKEPFEIFPEDKQKISDLGGTRHQSAAQFVFDQKEKNVFAIVASQDGRVSIIYWDANRFWNDEKGTLRKGIITVFRHAEYLFFGVNI